MVLAIVDLLRSPWTIVLTLVSLVVYKFVIKNWNFFDKIGIKYVRGAPILGVQYQVLLGKKTSMDTFVDLYKEHSKEQVIGAYDIGGAPMYVINDIDIAKRVTSKDFDHFTNHRFHIDKEVDPLLGRSMFATNDQDWKDIRSTTSPAFTGSKMRQMLSLINECTFDLCDNIKNEIQNKHSDTFDLKELMQRFVANTIASTAFGFKMNSFQDKDNEFYKHGYSAANLDGIKGMKFFAFQSIPKIMNFFKIRMMHEKDTEYFRSMIRQNMKYREENNIYRPDMIHLMMEARKGSLHHDTTSNDDIGFATVQESDYGRNSTKHLKFTEDDLVAQCMIFIFGGFNAVPTSQCFAAMEVAANVDIQDRLYNEIKSVHDQLAGQPLTYELLQNMKYMDQVVCETLRRWSIAPFSDREVNKPYTIELKNGKKIELKTGDGIWMPIAGYHMDEKYFPNPKRFDPERFSEENKKNIVQGSYIPFSIGPRNCVGSRYALMFMKVAIYYLVLNFQLELCEKSTYPIQLKLNTAFVDADFWVKLKPRT
ncbi:probable cytochrome P450 9f2 [Bradysia coprophila]|uniref:probable cytochrome P450 9f2 n=1 Tax=Bradysia coprophila TaxID=38358 RepID=UPI00187DAF8D|nr:probable cytochrome P450 9f2 [Bradysia coprophila]